MKQFSAYGSKTNSNNIWLLTIKQRIFQKTLEIKLFKSNAEIQKWPYLTINETHITRGIIYYYPHFSSFASHYVLYFVIPETKSAFLSNFISIFFVALFNIGMGLLFIFLFFYFYSPLIFSLSFRFSNAK